MSVDVYSLGLSSRPQYVPFAIPISQGSVVPLSLGQPCWAAIVRNASPYTVYVKGGVGISSTSDPLAMAVSPNSYGVVALSGAKDVAVRVDTPKTTAAVFQNPSITVTLSSVPVEPRETSLTGAAVTQISKVVNGVATPATVWTPSATTKRIRVYGLVLGGDTAGGYQASDAATGTLVGAGSVAANAGIFISFLPYGFLLDAAGDALQIAGPLNSKVVGMATGNEE